MQVSVITGLGIDGRYAEKGIASGCGLAGSGDPRRVQAVLHRGRIATINSSTWSIEKGFDELANAQQRCGRREVVAAILVSHDAWEGRGLAPHQQEFESGRGLIRQAVIG